MRKVSLSLLPALVLAALTAGPAFAQGTASSSITGVVVDTDGGFVPGATVLVKNEAGMIRSYWAWSPDGQTLFFNAAKSTNPD